MIISALQLCQGVIRCIGPLYDYLVLVSFFSSCRVKKVAITNVAKNEEVRISGTSISRGRAQFVSSFICVGALVHDMMLHHFV